MKILLWENCFSISNGPHRSKTDTGDDHEETQNINLNGVSVSIIPESDKADVDAKADNNESDDEDRQVWSNPIEFLLSCLSFAVGLGNIWRFPYLCYKNGGGAFLIPYALNIFLTGIPLFFFELAFGQFASKSPVNIWSISPLFQGLGLSMLVICVSVGTYYNVIISWTVYFFGATFYSLTEDHLPWTTCNNWWNSELCQELHSVQRNSSLNHHGNFSSAAEEYFSRNVLQITDGIEDTGSLRIELVICLAITWILTFIALWNGVKSFGKVVYFTAIFPYVILTILCVKGLTLPGAVDGVIFYIWPKWEKLGEPQVWADAAIQIFFSLGPCWGALITLSSYNKFSTNCFRDAVFIGLANCATSFFAGFVVFSFVGFMAYELDKDVEDVAKSGPGLAFVVYPEAVSLLPGAKLWALLFFLMILALGFGTQFTILEAVVTIIHDAWPKKWGRLSHRKILVIMCCFMFLFGLSMVTQGGIYVLQLLDSHAGTYSALINGFVEVVVVAWIYGVDRFLDDIQLMFKWGTRSIFFTMFQLTWKFMWKFVTPSLLLLILSVNFWNHEPLTYGEYTYPEWANCVGWFVTLASVCFIPIVAIMKLMQSEVGMLPQRIKLLMQCSADWGPKKTKDRVAAQKMWLENDYYFPMREMEDLSSLDEKLEEKAPLEA